MHARVFPTIVMMDTAIASRLIEDRLHLVVLHEGADRRYALNFIEQLQAHHGERIGPYAWDAEAIAYGAFDEDRAASAVYLLPTTPVMLMQSARTATDRGLVSFAYEENGIEFGVMTTLHVGRSSTPWLNIDTIRQSGITFKPTLIQIARHYP